MNNLYPYIIDSKGLGKLKRKYENIINLLFLVTLH